MTWWWKWYNRVCQTKSAHVSPSSCQKYCKDWNGWYRVCEKDRKKKRMFRLLEKSPTMQSPTWSDHVCQSKSHLNRSVLTSSRRKSCKGCRLLTSLVAFLHMFLIMFFVDDMTWILLKHYETEEERMANDLVACNINHSRLVLPRLLSLVENVILTDMQRKWTVKWKNSKPIRTPKNHDCWIQKTRSTTFYLTRCYLFLGVERSG